VCALGCVVVGEVHGAGVRGEVEVGVGGSCVEVALRPAVGAAGVGVEEEVVEGQAAEEVARAEEPLREGGVRGRRLVHAVDGEYLGEQEHLDVDAARFGVVVEVDQGGVQR